MIELLIILGVLAVAALAVTFGYRRSLRRGIDLGDDVEESPVVEAPASAPSVDLSGAAAHAPPATLDDESLPAPADAEPEPELEPEPEPEPIVKARLRDRLGKTRATLSGYVKGIAGRGIDSSTWDDLEEALLLADVGLETTEQLLNAVKVRVKADKVTQSDDVVLILRAEIESLLEQSTDRTLRVADGELNVWMFVGVNGVGKTTSIGKFAAQHRDAGRTVLLAAGDTFRAAAAEQLGQWAQRSGAEFVRGQQDADPGSVLFDAMASATSKQIDVVLVDTAGRLHNKGNLMAELEKLKRIIDRNEGALKEVLLVLDATTGQNGVQQAKQFAEVVNVTGIVLTKLDGSAKGGIVLAIQHELGIPVKAVGVGETIGDLIDFDPKEFAAALFEE